MHFKGVLSENLKFLDQGPTHPPQKVPWYFLIFPKNYPPTPPHPPNFEKKIASQICDKCVATSKYWKLNVYLC